MLWLNQKRQFGESLKCSNLFANIYIIGVNIGVPVPQTPFSFGGINTSRYSTHDITGEGCINFMINKKKTTTRW